MPRGPDQHRPEADLPVGAREVWQSGLTLVELVVVLAIISTLVGLLLPAVQHVREASRRVTCQNRLKQIGLALQMYHDSSNVLPPGWLSHDPETLLPDPDGVPGWGWAARILPFLEQAHVSQVVDIDQSIRHPNNEVARRTVVPNFICPSDIGEMVWQLENEDESGPLAALPKSNYVGVFGTFDVEDAPANGDGVFYFRSHTRFASVRDGLSNTFMAGERSSFIGFSTWLGVLAEGEESMDRIVGICDLPPNPDPSDYDEEGEMDDFSSYHVKGTVFLLADGSVRWVTESIDRAAYQALATRAGGEAVQP